MTKKKQKDIVRVIYKSKKVMASELVIPEGKFTVMDYYDKDTRKLSDREVYWTSEIIQISPHKTEYLLACDVLDNYLNKHGS
jgi:hypothetical protein